MGSYGCKGLVKCGLGWAAGETQGTTATSACMGGVRAGAEAVLVMREAEQLGQGLHQRGRGWCCCRNEGWRRAGGWDCSRHGSEHGGRRWGWNGRGCGGRGLHWSWTWLMYPTP